MKYKIIFFLISFSIDPDGKIVKEYNGMSNDDLQILVDDLKLVL